MAEPPASSPLDPSTFWSGYTAALFDLDGVLTPTAELHQQAWRTMFEQFLTDQVAADHAPYTSADYFAHIDGKPRFDGVRSFLASRGIDAPGGVDRRPARRRQRRGAR